MKTYKNTFEIFGDEAPCEAENERDFAQAYLPMFTKVDGRYRIDALRHSERVGWSNEIRWCDKVFEACNDIVEGSLDDDEPAYGFISEELLLDYLEEAVQEGK